MALLPMLQVKMFRLFTISNQFRNVICTKHPVTQALPSCGIKQLAIQKLGLPEKPKKPASAFFKFLKQIRPSILQENPNIKFTEVGKIAADKWEKVDPKIKSQLDSEYKQQMDIYNAAKLKYEANLTSKQKTDLKEARILEMEIKEKRKHKKKVKELGRPKKPLTSFLRYMLERMPARGNTSMRDEACPGPKVSESLKDWGTQEKENCYKVSSDLVKVEKHFEELKTEHVGAEGLKITNLPTEIIQKKTLPYTNKPDMHIKIETNINSGNSLSKSADQLLNQEGNAMEKTKQSCNNESNAFQKTIYNSKIIQNYSGATLAFIGSIIIIATYLKVTS